MDEILELLIRMFLAIFGVFLLIFSFIFVPFVIYRHKRKREARRYSMESQSKELGLTFYEHEDHRMVADLSFLAHLDEGEDRYALHNMWGQFDGHSVQAFDYHWKEEGVWWWAPSWHRHRYYSFITLRLENNFPELLLNAEGKGPFKRIADMFGSGDIDFESREFSERFDVRCKDKKFAYDFCNSRMIEYLMDRPLIPIELEKNVITVGFGKPVPVPIIGEHLQHLVEVRRLMPAYLFDS